MLHTKPFAEENVLLPLFVRTYFLPSLSISCLPCIFVKLQSFKHEQITLYLSLFSSLKMLNKVLSSFLCLIYLIQPIRSFYIPGVAPLDFEKGDNVDVKVIPLFSQENNRTLFFSFSFIQAVKMTSSKTQLPYDYYELPIHCKPSGGIQYKSENLGKFIANYTCL